MKLSYQDVGAWTMLTCTPEKNRQAAWLYAQYAVSKTVSLKKFVKGVTPIRKSDIFSDYSLKMQPNMVVSSKPTVVKKSTNSTLRPAPMF